MSKKAGQTLYTLTSTSETLTFTSVGFVCLAAIGSILPIYFKRKNSKFSEKTSKSEWKFQRSL